MNSKELEKSVAQLGRDIDQLKEYHDHGIRSLGDRINDCVRVDQDLKYRVSNLELAVARLQSDVSSLEGHISSIESELSSLRYRL